MSPTIEISEELYNKLSELAVGFATPESVIASLVEARESDYAGCIVRPSKSETPARTDPRSFVEAAFQATLEVTPRPFGQNAGKWVGASDDNKGVQWNIAMNRETGETYLGVNLEGIRYKNWPITNLLLSEAKEQQLPSFTGLPHADEITVNLTRDAWQAAARPPIRERQIDGSGTPLDKITQPLWKKMVADALECLNPNVRYKGRGRMEVTLLRSGERVTKEISPHLTFRTLVWEKQPTTIIEARDLIGTAQLKLYPLYEWVETRSK